MVDEDDPEESEFTPDPLKVTSCSEEDPSRSCGSLERLSSLRIIAPSDEPRMAVLGFSSRSWWCPESMAGAEIIGIMVGIKVRL